MWAEVFFCLNFVSSTLFSLLKTQPQYLKGVGPYLAGLLEKMGVETLEDLLYHLPVRYLDFQKVTFIRELTEGTEALVSVELRAAGETRLGRSGKKFFEAIFSDRSGTLSAKWFHYRAGPFNKAFQLGRRALLIGKVERFRGEKQMIHPQVEWIENQQSEENESVQGIGIVPLYPLTEGLHQKKILQIIRSALEKILPHIEDPLPQTLLEKYHLPDFANALLEIHQPSPGADLSLFNSQQSRAHKRIIFDEFFFLEMGLALKKKGILKETRLPLKWDPHLLERFQQLLPFQLTQAQNRAIDEILMDLKNIHPMHRLLQGDVGSGKTIVAAHACLAAISSGYQACLMAPTEILAEQHFKSIGGLFSKFGISLTLLKSELSSTEKKQRIESIRKGEVQCVIGTHALIQSEVEFQSLGLAVVDEQHRFGVLQRSELKKKGENPHLLIMTATPIPRTLALTAYGDLDTSILDELPPKRKPVTTQIVHSKSRVKLNQFIRDQIRLGRQAYVVCPLVEKSEALDLKNATEWAEHLKNEVFPDLKIGLLHGQMKGEEKDFILKNFLHQQIQILISTTVIEVGIDVSNATLMIIEHADRFGLSQLHQLRGRVGRGSDQSYCFLVVDWVKGEKAWERLNVLCETNDGFKIAEADLNLRGPGDFLGTRQAGVPDFRIANLVRDQKILEAARKEAFSWIESDPNLQKPESNKMKETLFHRWQGRLYLSQIG